jgi:hypothetical protein
MGGFGHAKQSRERPVREPVNQMAICGSELLEAGCGRIESGIPML